MIVCESGGHANGLTYFIFRFLRRPRFDLLICDDFSYVRRDQGETSVLFELIAERYERKSLAITANQPFSE